MGPLPVRLTKGGQTGSPAGGRSTKEMGKTSQAPPEFEAQSGGQVW